MTWVPLIAWAAAILFGLVVLSFCAYEVWWKANRMRSDIEKLRTLEEPAQSLLVQLTAAQERLLRATETR